MKQTELSHRFLADWPARHTPQAELVYGVPRRQNELIAIGRQQLEIQRSTAEEIVRSNIDAADIIAAEINQQTAALETSLQSLSDKVTSSVSDAADQVCWSIDILGARLCACLDEIKWQLAQIGTTLSGILSTLRQSRSNEARQLVEQGLRHYINGQYEQAEERFRLALIQDTTDYQVLLNLGLIAVKKKDSAPRHTTFSRMRYASQPHLTSRQRIALYF